MIRKIPIVGCPIELGEIFSPSRLPRDGLRKALAGITHARSLYFANSATSSFYIILEALIKLQNKKEVILPAYTASSLVFAVKKAGLKVRLCDITLDDFNMDVNLLGQVVTSNTLCIVGVHMFGIVQAQLKQTRGRFPGVFLVEDCAQAMGSSIGGFAVGSLGDVGFFSFNRGKNIPTYGGGCIATNDTGITKEISLEVEGLGIANRATSANLNLAAKVFVLSLVVNPWIYGVLYPFILRFKERAAPEDFQVADYSDFQAKIALSLLKKLSVLSRKRYENGMKIINGLKDIDGILLPKIQVHSEPAFNRLPVVFVDLNKKEKVQRRLWRAGIEASRMYAHPLHHMLELGYGKEDFPKAIYLAEHLLTIPVHPSVKERDLLRTIDIIKK